MAEKKLKDWIKPEVLAQPAYRVKSPGHQIKLNQNESPWDWPIDFKQKVLKRLLETPWNRYPDLIPNRLKKKLSELIDVSPQQIVVGKGSNEVLQALATVILRPGDEVCILAPTFAVYRMLGEQRSAVITESVLDKEFRVDEEDLLRKSQRAKLTIIPNPNTPTGTLLPLELIDKMAAGADGVIVVDEAYVDFSGVTALSLLENHPNLVITRTFSKAFALAGFRMGYAVMAADLAPEVQKGLLPFNMDIPSLLTAEILLDHAEWVQTRAGQIRKERDRLIARLNDLPGITAWPSHSNFFLLETPFGPEKTFDFLLSRGILVRDVSGYPGCENMVRITVGTPEENDILCWAIEEML
ncbi:MAG: histidinol-phosphate transaminase [FCB group bacterium]|nr:histidinol-phosphate transaminase [FCB group bacterium]